MDVRDGSQAEVGICQTQVRFTLKSGPLDARDHGRLWATSGGRSVRSAHRRDRSSFSHREEGTDIGRRRLDLDHNGVFDGLQAVEDTFGMPATSPGPIMNSSEPTVDFTLPFTT